MNKSNFRRRLFLVFVASFLLYLFLFGEPTLFVFTYCTFAVIMISRTFRSGFLFADKAVFSATYVIVAVFQTYFCIFAAFNENLSPLMQYIGKMVACSIVALPFLAERLVTYSKYIQYYFPSTEELLTLTFEQIKDNKSLIADIMSGLKKAKVSFSRKNLNIVIKDLRRHSVIRYINNGSLTEEYFELAYDSLKEPYIYIIISNTGSAASEIISVFTKKQYNHASLAFDENLKTIISYNGGENVYPPGLNYEIISYYNKKEDASILVYRLKASYEQKKMIIDKVKEINMEGSAYNLMGLVLKYSHKPNIMFCSQFVYKMLKYAGLEYFEKRAEDICPTDLIELDYYKKLEFAYEIFLNKPVLNKDVELNDKSLQTLK